MRTPIQTALFLAVAVLWTLAPCARAQSAAQSLSLKVGWNAVYLEVAPEGTPSEVFGPWPVDSVGVYDPSAFLATRQFRGGESPFDSEGLPARPILLWNRAYEEATTLAGVPAGVVCICYNTNLQTFATTIVGEPIAPRITWHPTLDGQLRNFVGVSLPADVRVTPEDYLAGFSEGVAAADVVKIGGRVRGNAPSEQPFYAGDTVGDGDVLVVESAAVSDWSGALFVSPMSGLDFGTNATIRTLSVRNDGGSARMVSLQLDRAVAELDPSLPFVSSFLRWRDEDVARTNTAWNTLSGFGEIARKHLEAGETWRVAFGLDRTQIPDGTPRGTAFGALLTALDVDGSSKMKAIVPLRGAASGIAAAATAWPAGLWVADVAFGFVRSPGSGVDTETGGTAKARLLLHVDAENRIRLLQRVVAAGEIAPDGAWSGRLYAGNAEIPATASEVMRLSSVVLPTETPVVEADPGGSLRDGATFRFTVAADGATSLLRHPLHPQHDGLRWDFKTPAPSGDVPDNYKLDVKPETFSVSCRIDLAISLDGGEAVWNPEATKDGLCRWTFSGLMRQGDLSISGRMSVKRVSPLAELILE